jgi:hypothetical protein
VGDAVPDRAKKKRNPWGLRLKFHQRRRILEECADAGEAPAQNYCPIFWTEMQAFTVALQ